MKYQPFFNDILGCQDDQAVFDHLKSTMRRSLWKWDYFVNWKSVLQSHRAVVGELQQLNVLVGMADPKEGLTRLLNQHPGLMRLVPRLLALPEDDLEVLTSDAGEHLEAESYSFIPETPVSSAQVDRVVEFADKSGFLDRIRHGELSTLSDYILGVEVGRDTNARKNRGGKTMESAVARILTPIAATRGYTLLSQASSQIISTKLGMTIAPDRSDRKFDFALGNGKTLYLVETNFYAGGGSKLKATAGEYHTLASHIRNQGHTLIWITDGQGWRSTLRPLREAFDHIDYTLNLDMLGRGILDAILS